MKRIISLLLALIMITGCLFGCDESEISTENTPRRDYDNYTKVNGHTIARGINLTTYRSANYGSDEYLLKNSTYKGIASKGFDHIRLATDFRFYSIEDGVLDLEAMKTIDTAIKLANDNGLVVFLDFHGWYNLNMWRGEDERFYKIWKSVAEHYKDYERNDMLVFEIINEPHNSEGSDLHIENLDELVCTAADIIREISPDRTLCFPTADSNKPFTLRDYEHAISFRDTKMMEYDNIIVAVHIYQPDEWTGQDIDWAGTKGQFVRLDEVNIVELKMGLKDMADFKKETGIPVILGEFGWNTLSCLEEDQILYMQTVMDCLDENGIPCTWWAYSDSVCSMYKQGTFFKKGQWNETLLEVMMK